MVKSDLPCLFYIHDPMCSWCYALSRSWIDLQKELPSEMEIVYVLGGLAPDTAEPMPLSLQKTVQQAWQRIEQTVPDIRFNWNFWTNNVPMRSTYPACRAVLAAENQNADAMHAMISAIQRAYYQEAKNPSLPETLLECAAGIGLDTGRFGEDLTSQATEQQLQKNIQLARSMNVFSYPSLLLQHQGIAHAIPVDYMSHRSMLKHISRIIQF